MLTQGVKSRCLRVTVPTVLPQQRTATAAYSLPQMPPHLRALLRHHAPKVLAVVLPALLVVQALVNHVAGWAQGSAGAGWGAVG